MTPQAFNRGTQFGAAGSSRNQYVTVEGGRDSSTNYADRRRLRALAALQQPVAEPAARRRAGSEPAPQLVLDRVRPGAGGRVDRHEIRHEPLQRFGLRASRATTNSTRRTTSPRRSAERAQPVRVHGRRSDRAQQGVRVRRVRRPALDPRPHVPRDRAIARAAERRLFERRDADHRSADRAAVSRQSDPGQPVLELCPDPGADRSGAEQRRRQQLPGGPRLHRRRRYGDHSSRSGAGSKHTLFQRYMQYDGRAEQPGRVHRTRTCRRRAGTWPSAKPGSCRRRSSTSSGSATTTPIT